MTANRYHRQRLQIGEAAQNRLSAARVLIVGAGGLGCPALLYLAGAGIGTLGIIDPDTADLSNLHRQVLFTMADIGRNKAEAAKERLATLNPEITYHAYAEALTAENAIGLFSAYDLIIDATDSFAATYLINDTAVKLGKPWIYGAMEGSEGRVALFDASTSCYRCCYPHPPQAIIRNCAETGIIGALAGVIGTLQAWEAIHHLIGQPRSAGVMHLFDGAGMQTQRLAIPRRADCPTCSRPATAIVPSYASPVCYGAGIEEISCAALPEAGVFIDVREREEWDEGHIPNAQHLPLSALKRNPECFAPYAGQDIILYCQRGTRSAQAAQLLSQSGFAGIRSLAGGIEAWQAYAASRKSG